MIMLQQLPRTGPIRVSAVTGETKKKDFRIKQKHIPTHEIPKDIESVEVGHLATSVDVSSCH